MVDSSIYMTIVYGEKFCRGGECFTLCAQRAVLELFYSLNKIFIFKNISKIIFFICS